MTSISTAELDKKLQSDNSPLIFDVRKKPAFDSDPKTIANATWQDHETANDWGIVIPKDKQIVVYCVHGHEVSQNAAKALRDLGLSAVYLQGGIAEWTKAGLATA